MRIRVTFFFSLQYNTYMMIGKSKEEKKDYTYLEEN